MIVDMTVKVYDKARIEVTEWRFDSMQFSFGVLMPCPFAKPLQSESVDLRLVGQATVLREAHG